MPAATAISSASSSDRDYFLASQERWPINHPPTVAAETCARTGWNCKIRSQMHQSMEGWIFPYRSIDGSICSSAERSELASRRFHAEGHQEVLAVRHIRLDVLPTSRY
jgi:hypothetical protein